LFSTTDESVNYDEIYI